MTAENPHQSLESGFIAHSGSEVLDNLVTANGQRLNDDASQSIMNQFIENDVRVALFIGPPGQGKTATLNQFGQELLRRTGGKRGFSIETFEASIPDAEREMGPKADWTRPEWQRHGEIQGARIETRLAQLRDGDVLLVETPSVGGVNEGTDRGVSAAINLTRTHPVDSMVLAIIGDPKIEKIAQGIRRRLRKVDESGAYIVPDEQVLSYLRKHKQLVSGIEDLGPQESGRIVREAYLAMDPNPSTEMDRYLDPFTKQGRPLPEGARRLPEIVEMRLMARKLALQGRQVAPAPQFPGETAAEAHRNEELSLYFHRILFPQLGNVTDRAFVLFNRYLGRPIHYLGRDYLNLLQSSRRSQINML